MDLRCIIVVIQVGLGRNEFKNRVEQGIKMTRELP